MSENRPQRRFDDVIVGDELVGASYPLPVYRMVMAAAGTRDFSAIHHNDDVARAAGAPHMYANAIYLQGMWERVIRDYIGLAGTILAVRDFRMRQFTPAGSVARVQGRVIGKRRQQGKNVVEIRLETLVGTSVTVGPGTAEVTLP